MAHPPRLPPRPLRVHALVGRSAGSSGILVTAPGSPLLVDALYPLTSSGWALERFGNSVLVVAPRAALGASRVRSRGVAPLSAEQESLVARAGDLRLGAERAVELMVVDQLVASGFRCISRDGGTYLLEVKPQHGDGH